MEIVLPAPCLVVNIGISGSGKSTFARKHFAPSEVISSDHYRQMICDHPHSMEATSDAFDLVYTIAKMRLKRGLVALIDSTAVETFAREDLLGIATELGVPAVGLAYDIPLDVCLTRDARRAYTVGERVIREQFGHLQNSRALFDAEGWHSFHWIDLVTQDSAGVRIDRKHGNTNPNGTKRAPQTKEAQKGSGLAAKIDSAEGVTSSAQAG